MPKEIIQGIQKDVNGVIGGGRDIANPETPLGSRHRISPNADIFDGRQPGDVIGGRRRIGDVIGG